MRGLEPPLLSKPEPKSGASASFATSARAGISRIISISPNPGRETILGREMYRNGELNPFPGIPVTDATPIETRLFIAGDFVPAADGGLIPVYNPHDNTLIAKVADATAPR